MQVNNSFDVGQTQTKALHVMDIAGMDAVELVEYLLDVLLLDAQSRVANREAQAVLFVPCPDIEVQRFVRLSILHCIIHQIGDGILEVNLVHIDSRIDCLNLSIYLTACMLHTQREC